MNKIIGSALAVLLFAAPAVAQQPEAAPAAGAAKAPATADEIAKELANPAGSLASLNSNFQYTTYKGDLPGGRQDGWSFLFQPVLPWQVGDKGRRVIFRPLVPVNLSEPVFKVNKNGFDNEGIDLGDIGFDLVFAGTEMTDPAAKKGFLWGVGAAGTLPTGTGNFQGNQWRLGPEVFGGIIRKWGVLGGLLNNQWKLGGSNDSSFSVTSLQYFYAYGLGKGWQIAASPLITYDWHADGGDAWTVPIGVGVAKTTKFGSLPMKFQFQVQKFVVQPDAFGPDWLFKLTITPVIKNPFIF